MWILWVFGNWFQFHFEDTSAVFYVNDSRAAEAIKSVTKRITMPNGYKVGFHLKDIIFLNDL